MSESSKKLNREQLSVLANLGTVQLSSLKVYERAMFKDRVWTSLHYKRSTRRNDAIIFKLGEENEVYYGLIEYFVKGVHPHSTVVLVLPCEVIPLSPHLQYWLKVNFIADRLVAIPVQNVVNKCVFVQFSNSDSETESLISFIPNTIEAD